MVMATMADEKVCGWPVSGSSPVLFKYDGLQDGERYSQDRSWNLLNKGYPYLNQDNFVDYDTFLQYWIVSMGLLDYAAVIFYGPEGKGKSLGQAWCEYQGGRLFNKKLALDWSPPIEKTREAVDRQIEDLKKRQLLSNSKLEVENLEQQIEDLNEQAKNGNLICPEVMRNAYRLADKSYRDRIQNEINRLAEYQVKNGALPPKEELEKLIIYDSWWGFDESQMWGDKARITNFTVLIANILDIRRHLKTSMFFTYIDPNRAYKRIADRITHLVSCNKDSEYKDTCTYSFFYRRRGIAKKLHLRPKDWTHIWDSFSIPAVSHGMYVYLGGKKPPKSLFEGDTENNSSEVNNNA